VNYHAFRTLPGTSALSVRFVAILALVVISGASAVAQDGARRVNFKMFGHVEYVVRPDTGQWGQYFSLGEQDLFVTARITDKLSFLGETVVKFSVMSQTSFLPSIERAQLKYDYYRNHSVLIGKMHTPVNYWNDVYHHGRLFFPSIDRPTSFSYFVPLHTLGLRLQGQNLGPLGLGYDVVVGNGMSSTDFFKVSPHMSFMVAAHIKPFNGAQFTLSYYRDRITDNQVGVHVGHSHSGSGYKGDIGFQLISLSAVYFSEKFEVLNEAGLNINTTDSTGTVHNYSNYTYVGYRLKDKFVPYVLSDLMMIDRQEMHSPRTQLWQAGVGLRYEMSHLFNIKLEMRRATGIGYAAEPANHPEIKRYQLKLQFSYGF